MKSCSWCPFYDPANERCDFPFDMPDRDFDAPCEEERDEG